jgi:LPXTG-motif cell wall-anchored protein
MSRDTVKTLSGLLVIGAIVVATFLYGNAQRQSQLKHDQAVKNQQASTQQQGADASPSSSASAAPASNAPKSTASTKANNGTAPVQSVTPNTIQGSKSTSTSSKSPASPKPSATPAGKVAGAATTPVTGGTAQPLPDTGSPLLGGMGLAAIAFMLLWLRRSKRSLFSALRGNRPAG